MKKLITCCISLLTIGMFAQSSITAYKTNNAGTPTETLTNGYNLQLTTSSGAIEETKIKFKNNAAVSNTYNVVRSFIVQNPTLFIDGGGINTPNSYFCFGQTCFPDNIFTADPSNYTLLNAGEDSKISNQPMSIYLAEGTNVGYYIVRYKFFNVNNANDTLTFNAVYNGGSVGIKTQSSIEGVSELYPNPTSGTSVSFDLAKDDELKFQVYNSLGSLVYSAGKQKYSAGKNKLALDAASLANGVYFVTITSNSAETTKRLIVNK